MNPPVQIEVIHETGTAESVEVETIKLANYPAAYAAHSAGDEFRLVEIACGGRPRGWAVGLTPESYDQLIAATYNANPGFFAYSARQTMSRGVGNVAAEMLRGRSGSPTSASGRG